jgi:hypothetical protein
LSTNTAEKKINGVDVARCLGGGEIDRNAGDPETKM